MKKYLSFIAAVLLCLPCIHAADVTLHIASWGKDTGSDIPLFTW